MLNDFPSKSRNLLGVSELTVVAPIKRGLIPALDSRSYDSRLRLTLKTLHGLRVSSQEAEPTPLIVDAVDRIRAIHSFRLALLEPENKLMLAVTFDGGWEPYMRRIWRDLGPLLDLIFCNCDGYLSSHDHGFAEYAGWVRSAQPGTEFFYNASPLTINDLHYLRATAQERLDGPAARAPAADRTLFEQTLPALTALYRLADMYPPLEGSDDGACLRRAAHRLLQAFDQHLGEEKAAGQALPVPRTPVEKAALAWYVPSEKEGQAEQDKKQATEPARAASWNRSNVQGGIIDGFTGLTHGCLLLVNCEDAAAVQHLIEHVADQIVSAEMQARVETELFFNLGFTLQGLKLAGVPSGTLAALPQEFKEGMASRAGILGDVLHNHPTRWALPERNWPPPAANVPERVELSSVHVVVQCFLCGTPSLEWQALAMQRGNALGDAVFDFDAKLSQQGVRILSLQPLQRFAARHGETPKDHFGFVDGLSQPQLGAAPGQNYSDNVAPGDLLLGYDNSLGDRSSNGRLWDDSTFLVIRKLRQDVGAFNKVLQHDAVPPDDAKAQLMGRKVDGSLPDGTTGNDFNHDADLEGARCPLQSHIRRVNPRTTRDDMRTVPRIVRRGMSYGPRAGPDADNAQRGLVFMAYNASIAEQFEVLQSWLVGGNSGGGEKSWSALRDPLLGVRRDGDPANFWFRHADARQSLDLASQQPLVKLEWGVYLFVPSLAALDELERIAEHATEVAAATGPQDAGWKAQQDQRKAALAAQAQKGAAVMARLRMAEQAFGLEQARAQWKIALEDIVARSAGISQAIWTAVRELHGGVLRTPCGVLVSGRDQVKEVLSNDRRYSVTGYAERMKKSFGDIYLGMDNGDEYRRLSADANAAIMSVSRKEAFASAHRHAQAAVATLTNGAPSEQSVDVKDLVDHVLGGLSVDWFGLPDGEFVHRAGLQWQWQAHAAPTCPGYFTAPSRYMFQPNPGPQATALGERHGAALAQAVRNFAGEAQAAQRRGTLPSNILLRAFLEKIGDLEQLTRTLIGAMMGFLPTVDGNLRSTLYEWTNDRSLWDHRIAYQADRGATPFERAQSALLEPLTRTMQLRPVPELVWRTAREAHALGSVNVMAGERIVVGLVSASQ